VIAWLCSARALIVLLLVSLAANLLLGGVLVGRIAGETPQGSQTRRSIQAMIAPLPMAKRELVKREINAAMPQVQLHLAALQKARTALAEEMVKSMPDSGALERGFRCCANTYDGDQGRVSTGHTACATRPHARRAPRTGQRSGSPPKRERSAAGPLCGLDLFQGDNRPCPMRRHVPGEIHVLLKNN